MLLAFEDVTDRKRAEKMAAERKNTTISTHQAIAAALEVHPKKLLEF